MAAILLEVAFLVVAVGLRSWVHWRRTRTSPFRSGGAHGPAAMVGASVLFGAGPVLDIADVLPRLVSSASLSALGAALAAAGIGATLWAQFAMGESWRIGLDEKERTALVVGGPFRWVRNPIYSAMVLFALGIAAEVPNVVSLAAVAVLVAVLEYTVRTIEEPYLEGVHGSDYRRWASQAGRFVPRLGRVPG
jgi:protein-S-isoprenylcysteine O-methyltransferase Ste14